MKLDNLMQLLRKKIIILDQLSQLYILYITPIFIIKNGEIDIKHKWINEEMKELYDQLQTELNILNIEENTFLGRICMKCDKHKYKKGTSFCPDCEFEKLLKQDTKIQKEIKENKFEKAIHKGSRKK